MSLTILSDFDGVLTSQIQEAVRVQEIAQEILFEPVSTKGIVLKDIKTLWSTCRQYIYTKAHLYGWRMEGRLSAFCNEDLFIEGMGISQLLDELKVDSQKKNLLLGESSIQKTFDSLAAEIPSFGEISKAAYTLMTRETSLGKHKPLENSGANALKSWLQRGHRVFIVSNSETARIEEMLAGAKLWPHPNLHILGGARKFELGISPDITMIGNYAVERDRPRYLSLLKQTQPHIVIGDVFSLDLALPLKLKQDSTIPLQQCFLMKREYTPKWVQNALETHFSGEITPVNQLPIF